MTYCLAFLLGALFSSAGALTAMHYGKNYVLRAIWGGVVGIPLFVAFSVIFGI